MALFYFNMIGEDVVSDLEGSELASLEIAREEALKDARIIMSEAVLRGNDVSGRHIEICSGSGETLLVVNFSDAVTRCP